MTTPIHQAFELARQRYAELGVDVHAALQRLSTISISMHCWQGDDVVGFEGGAGALGNGLAVTGNYPGRARTPDELRSDLELAYSLIPGKHRLNLHALYGEFERPVERDEIEPNHFQGWIDWAREHSLSIDFNPSYFSHAKAADGFTLSHSDSAIRRFWIDHGKACRHIAVAFGKSQGNPSINNVWIPDGMKDSPADRHAPRERLMHSLDSLFEEELDPQHVLDAVEAKLFGIGSESYVVGSHEFYLGYATTRNKLLCLDAGHFHPTEGIADKISSTLLYVPELLLHVSRGVRWDSDHVVTYSDELQAIMQEIVRGDFLSRVHIGLDFFDASINRIAAWVIGTRNSLKALLAALLEPTSLLKRCDIDGNYTLRLALMEELKSMPFGAIWDYYCQTNDVPVGMQWLSSVQSYEADVLVHRSSPLFNSVTK
ncbi:MAG: L-rhamnose isomerase [Pirellula sp.]